MLFTVLILALIVTMVLFVCFSTHAPDHWHVDPLAIEKHARPNQFLMRSDADAEPPVFDMTVDELAQKFDTVAKSKPNVEVVAGSADQGWVTYVQRSRLMAYPDYISVKFLPLDEGKSTLAVYSRSRFGKSDLGVNKARVRGWVSAVGQ